MTKRQLEQVEKNKLRLTDILIYILAALGCVALMLLILRLLVGY